MPNEAKKNAHTQKSKKKCCVANACSDIKHMHYVITARAKRLANMREWTKKPLGIFFLSKNQYIVEFKLQCMQFHVQHKYGLIKMDFFFRFLFRSFSELSSPGFESLKFRRHALDIGWTECWCERITIHTHFCLYLYFKSKHFLWQISSPLDLKLTFEKL